MGTASELPLARRAQLAVVAHIRHMYTDYDNLLKKTSFQEARRQVEEATLEKLVQWRGDDENGSSELEDVFREVIVIDDDEDDEADEDQQKKSASTDRDSSIEVVSASAAADHLETRPINIQTTQEDDKDASEQEAHQGISVVQGSMIRPEDRKVDRRGFSRYDRAWDRAMNRYRERMSTSRRAELESLSSNQRTYMPFHGPRYEADRKVLETVQDDDYRILPARHIVDPQLERRAPAPNGPYYRELPGYRDVDVYHLDGSSAITSQQQVSYSMSSGANAPQRPPDILHFPDGSVFEKAPSSSGDPAFHWERPAEPVFVRGSSVHYRTQDNPRKRVHEVVEMPSQGMEASPRSHVVLPSIETPDSSVVMPWREDEVRNFTMMPDVSLKNSPRTSGRRVDDLSHGINVIDLTDDGDVPKRRRLEGQESVHENRAPVSPSGHHLHSASSLWRPSQRFASYELRPLHDTAESLGPNAVVHGRRPVAAPRHELVPLSPRAHLRADMAPAPAPAPAQPVYRGLGDRVMWEPAERPAVPYSTYIPEGQSVADGRYVGHTETRYVTTRDGDRHPDLDGPAWRSKARSYELERRLIDAQESRAQDFRVVETRPAYQREQRPEAGYYTEEAMTNRAAPHVHRVSGHIPVPVSDTDSDSGRYAPYPSRRKGALPASAVRRYRFEREKTFRATQYEILDICLGNRSRLTIARDESRRE